MSTFPLNQDVNIVLNLSPAAAPRNGFNLGMIMGTSNRMTAGKRTALVSGLSDITALGFQNTDPEYTAAELVFGAPVAPTQLLIGAALSTDANALAAFQACRYANSEWYIGTYLGANKADILSIAGYTEAAQPATVQFYTTGDSAVLNGTSGNVALTAQFNSYKRTLGQYSTQVNAVCSILGYAMGANTGLANSSYTLKFKQEPGVTPENQSATGLNTQQLNNILAANGNVYVNKGSYYNMFEPGVMANGLHFDEVIGLDQLANNIQLNVMDLFYQVDKVPYTDAGVQQIISSIASACEQAVTTGFIAPGIWQSPSILNLSNGDMLDKGYVILHQSVNIQSPANVSARIAPPIYVCINLAGAIESIIIQINVNL